MDSSGPGYIRCRLVRFGHQASFTKYMIPPYNSNVAQEICRQLDAAARLLKNLSSNRGCA
eukprot:58671-Pleurochrysis_carterae.AAC.9